VNGLGGVKAVVAGFSHVCVLTDVGGVKCWGLNLRGQLGNGTVQSSTAPVDVTGLPSGVIAIVAGINHTCALLTGGAVKCWGDNFAGQLGDGTKVSRNVPTAVSELGGPATALAAGGRHTCAVVGGGAKCWGNNLSGQIGDGSTTPSTKPVAVSGLTAGVTALAGGNDHTCAVVGGGAQCWGANSFGQIGDGTTTQRKIPVPVSELAAGVTALTAGYSHTCALLAGGAAKCWGSNGWLEVGDGTATTPRTTPSAVTGMDAGATQMAAGVGFTCAVVGGAAKCWGDNYFGQLGRGDAWRTAPVAVDVGGASPTSTPTVTPTATPTGHPLRSLYLPVVLKAR
jgi:alpha-tubulin suppressor-like RCC1 family protein